MSVAGSSTNAPSAIEITTPMSIVSEISTTASNYLSSTVVPNFMKADNRTQDEQVIFHFGWLDYGIFIALLGMSTLIGVFYGFFSKHKQNNTNEYILGGRSMKIIPVATSLIASSVSDFTIQWICDLHWQQVINTEINGTFFVLSSFPVGF